MGFPSGPAVKNLHADAGDMGLIPRLGILTGIGNGNPLQNSCLGNPMDRGAFMSYSPLSDRESDMTEHTCTQSICMLLA